MADDIIFIDNSAMVLEEFEAACLQALIRRGTEAEEYAKDLCPVGTPESTGVPGYVGGLLRNSITFAISGKKPQINSYQSDNGERKGNYDGSAPADKNPSVYIGTNVEYAPYVECRAGAKNTPGGRPDSRGYIDDEGRAHHTGGQQAQPFLKPAIADHKQTYKNIIEDELKNE